MSLFKVAPLVVVLLAIPSVTYAHSGTVFKAVVNYIPLALALASVFSRPVVELVKKIRAIFMKKRD
ncbi:MULTISPECIES: hypothetical protein [Sporomusa]|uniref:Holin n=1 Tax=Sporomusa sphaeroides DSM 2875 TaxID=1337886 RepID=A0ABP2C857_9FIRM|nr:hypothetical protein [Sporomusa sphaeroides]OLS57092.1 hypothetical protein SPSPH_05940 [Sporomusa sphaeroides DSM 2875]CVK18278.1 hypothetical protein SSPH_00915 [Sporomusa sphaeroides DSM 2875]